MEAAILQEMGFSPNESKIYLALLKHGKMAVSELSRKTGIHRRNVYDALNRLLEKGLAFQIIAPGENVIEPINPAKLVEILKEREIRLNRILPGLQEQFEQQPSGNYSCIYKGIEGFKNCLRDVLRVEEDLYIIGAKGFWFDPRLSTFTDQFLKEAKQKKLSLHHIFDREIAEEYPEIVKKFRRKKILPAEYSTQIAANIFGDYVVTFTGLGTADLGRDVSLFVNVNRQMADGFRTWFKLIWDSCD